MSLSLIEKRWAIRTKGRRWTHNQRFHGILSAVFARESRTTSISSHPAADQRPNWKHKPVTILFIFYVRIDGKHQQDRQYRNTMTEKESWPKVERVTSTKPVSNLEAFDIMSRFLATEKAKQLSLDISGKKVLASSSQAWNDLRLACNSLLEENDPRREPVAVWKEEFSSSPQQDEASPPDESSTENTPPGTEETDKEARRSAKKEKKEAKKARKEAKKERKEAKKEAKKARKESKKRKREEA